MRLNTRLYLPLLVLSAALAPCELVWWDGTGYPDDSPPGKLLSDNDGYWGECVLTGVEYEYEVPPTNPADVWRNVKEKYGRRLLDGRPAGNWWVPVGQNPARPMVVTFDFKRPCTFTEIDVCTRSKKISIKAECADSKDGEWQPVLERGIDQCPDRVFHRLPVPGGTRGRLLRLSLKAEYITYIEEVLVWGDAEVSEETPEALRPVAPVPVITGTAFASIPGIEKTSFSDAQYWDWQRAIGDAARQPAVWSQVATWDSITDKPILPAATAANRPVTFAMARNETECAALALTNTSMTEPRGLEVQLSSFKPDAGGTEGGVGGEVRVAGAIPSRHFGVNVGPLFEADNMLSRGLMRRYLTNGAGITDFPKVTLSPAGSAVLWLSVTSRDAAPGTYEATLSCGPGVAIDVRIEVVDVALPDPFVWLNTWSGIMSMFPFVYGDRMEREVAYKQSLGITVWNGWPEPGTPMALARERGRTIHRIWGIGGYGHKLYKGQIDPDNLPAEDEQKIAEMIRGHVAKAAELGLSYDDWFVELTDEPGQKNSPAYGGLCRLIRKTDPKVRIYCNPCFWIGNGVLGDDEVFESLGSWYRENVDVSVPLYLLLRDRPKSFELFDSKRFVRAFYNVSTQSAKSERAAQVELYRRQAWDAFARGWNGWGFYSYHAGRGDPWNDMDMDWYSKADRPDYLMVYPGPRGPVPTRQSEAVREGWEDYRLLTLLRERGHHEVDALVRDHLEGKPLTDLRLRALRLAAGGP